MQEHPIPRQITTFEFKLIGELTIHQFIYLAFGSVVALILFFAVPGILYINIVAAALPALIGIGFAFVPVNDRPMDVWLKNLIRRLTSPTQYYFKKNNLPPKILLGITLPPREILQQHLLAQQKLNAYLQNKPKTTPKEDFAVMDKTYDEKRRKLQELFNQPTITHQESRISSQPTTNNSRVNEIPSVVEGPQTSAIPISPISPPAPRSEDARSAMHDSGPATSFIVRGEVYAGTGIPIPGILAYVKQNDKIVRLFKTDDNGVFANNLPIPHGEYVLTLEDPRKKYTFDTMKIDGTLPSIVVFAHKGLNV